MTEIVNNNAKNVSNNYMPFELNCKYHPWIFYKEDIDSHFKFKLADKLLAALRELITVCRKNLYYTQELQ